MELALEAAPVGNIQQEVDIRGSLQFLDSRLRLGQLGPEPANGPLGVIGRCGGKPRRRRRLRRPGALGRGLARRRTGFAAFRRDWSGCALVFFFMGHP